MKYSVLRTGFVVPMLRKEKKSGSLVRGIMTKPAPLFAVAGWGCLRRVESDATLAPAITRGEELNSHVNACLLKGFPMLQN